MDYTGLKIEAIIMAESFQKSGYVILPDKLKMYATAITDLLARAEAAEQKATELDKALSDAAKVVRTMQERTIPYYRNRADAAEKEVEWKNKVIEAAERRFVEAEARAEKAERERDAAVEDISDILARIDDVRERIGIENADADSELAELCAAYCSIAGKMCYKRGESCKCENFKWRG